MLTKEHFKNIANKYREFASWAIWADEKATPKSKIGDFSIFKLEKIIIYLKDLFLML